MRYLIEAWLSDDETRSSFLTHDSEPALVDEKDLEHQLRNIRAGTGDLGDWSRAQSLGDWRVAKILAHPLGEPRDVTQEPIPVPKSVNGNEILVDSMFRAADGTAYYSCRWVLPVFGVYSFLLIYDTVTVKFANGVVVDCVEWVGDR